MRSSAVAYLFFGLLDLALGPGLQGFLPQGAYLLDQPVFGIIGTLESRIGTLRQFQQRSNAASESRVLA